MTEITSNLSVKGTGPIDGHLRVDELGAGGPFADQWFLVDVRTPGEFAGAHIRGSRNVPLGDRWRLLLRGEAGYSDATVRELELIEGDERFTQFLYSIGVVPNQLPNLFSFLVREILHGRKLVVFPEAALTGYVFESLEEGRDAAVEAGISPVDLYQCDLGEAAALVTDLAGGKVLREELVEVGADLRRCDVGQLEVSPAGRPARGGPRRRGARPA